MPETIPILTPQSPAAMAAGGDPGLAAAMSQSPEVQAAEYYRIAQGLPGAGGPTAQDTGGGSGGGMFTMAPGGQPQAPDHLHLPSTRRPAAGRIWPAGSG